MKAEDACVGIGVSCQAGLPTGDAFWKERISNKES